MYTPTEATMEEEWEADAQEEQDDAEGEDLIKRGGGGGDASRIQ